MKNYRFSIAVLFSFCISAQIIFLSVALAESRLALVIGNSAYNLDPLKTPANDARLMTDTLQSLHFELFGGRAYIDVTQTQMRRLIRDFAKELARRPESVGLFYYSGHGMQVDNRNFILPVDAEIEDQADVRAQGVSIDEEVLWRMSQATPLVNIVLLDSCRNNPFEKRVKSLGASKGLGDMSAEQGSIIGFASEPNTVAYESKGNYSYFTEALAREIVKPGVSITQVLRRVRVAVRDATNGEQIPTTREVLFDDFYPVPEHVSALQPSGPVFIAPPSPAQIRQVQVILRALGFNPGPVDGVWGRQTESAIREYQQSAELRVTAARDSATVTALGVNAPQKITNSIGMELVLIPAGEFQMGHQVGFDDEYPTHRVRISEPFYMGKYEVTQAQWEAAMGTNPSQFKGNPNRPVENVSWDDVQEFIKRLNRQEGWEVCRLPTEAQWEYAARAGTTTHWYENDVDAIAWYRENSREETHEVGQKRPNAWGLYDMLGNVSEWCHDGKRMYTNMGVLDPIGPTEAGAFRLIRGGSWYVGVQYVRAVYRDFLSAPSNRRNDVGFRCASPGPGLIPTSLSPAAK